MAGKYLAIIVSYNGFPEIIHCIESLQKGTCLPDLLVIDNNSTDTSILLLKELGIELIQLSENMGFGNAMNKGLTRAIQKKYEGVFLINQDVVVDKNCIQSILKSANNTQVISPIHLGNGKYELDQNFEKILKRQKINTRLKTWKDTAKRKEFPFVNAAFWYIPSALLNKIGGFNPVFFFTGEDVNFCNRLIFHGASVKIETSAEIQHRRVRNLDKATESRIFRASAEADILQFLLNINDSFFIAYLKCCAFLIRDSILKSDLNTLRWRCVFLIKWTKSLDQISLWRTQTKQQAPHFL